MIKQRIIWNKNAEIFGKCLEKWIKKYFKNKIDATINKYIKNVLKLFRLDIVSMDKKNFYKIIDIYMFYILVYVIFWSNQ